MKSNEPRIPKAPQMQIPYAVAAGEYMSARVLPPVARAGLPKNPVIVREIRNMGMLMAKPVGSCNRTKAVKVQK